MLWYLHGLYSAIFFLFKCWLAYCEQFFLESTHNLDMKYLLGAAIFCLFQATSALNGLVQGYPYEEPLLYDTFPDGFEWGAATAAYQVLMII